MLLRLAYLSVTNAFALLRLLPMSDRDKVTAERWLDPRPHQLRNTALIATTASQ
jgi:hypothetical protein